MHRIRPAAAFLLLSASLHAEMAEPVMRRDADGLVSITCPSPGAAICHSADGTDPDSRSGAAWADAIMPTTRTLLSPMHP